MVTRNLCLLLVFASAPPAAAVPLAPHSAVYDLSLVAQSRDLVSVDGRISFELSAGDCSAYELEYRFVARFGAADEITLTDQRITAREHQDGSSYEFSAQNVVDGVEQGRVEGTARSQAQETRVEMRLPVERGFSIPLSHFPLGHTGHLIERARAGERLVESRLYDGEPEGENLLTTTAIIVPVPAAGTGERIGGLGSLAAWRVDESYFNAESDADGMPVFHTRYTLFENGVTDDLYMDFGDYALEGGLSELTIGERPPECP